MPEPYVNMQFEISIKLAQEETDRSVKVVAVRRETQRHPVQSAACPMPRLHSAGFAQSAVHNAQCKMARRVWVVALCKEPGREH